MGSTELRERGTDPSRLTDKERKFVAEYPIDFNGRRAVVAAGYSKKGATVMACKLLKKPRIKAALGKLLRQDLEEVELERHEALRQLVYALTREQRDFFDAKTGLPLHPHDLPDRCQSIVDGFKAKVLHTAEDGSRLEEIEYKLTPHAAAREQAMKHKGLFTAEIHEHKLVLDLQALSRDDSDGKLDAIEAKIHKAEEE